ncbi:hypothetical protein JCM19992_20110 [Thermostilla marina]
MSSPFNPYHQWLNRPPDFEPQDHYSLLGIPRFTEDLDTIRRTADALLASVRRIRPGEHLKEWARLLDELETAKKSLLDPDSKAAYDASLRGSKPTSTTGDTTARSARPSPPQFSYRPKAALGPARPEPSPTSMTTLAQPDETAASPVDDRPVSSMPRPAISPQTSVPKPKLGTVDVLYRAGAFGLLLVAVVLAGIVVQRVRAHLQLQAETQLADASKPARGEEPPSPPPVTLPATPEPGAGTATATSAPLPPQAASPKENGKPSSAAGSGSPVTTSTNDNDAGQDPPAVIDASGSDAANEPANALPAAEPAGQSPPAAPVPVAPSSEPVPPSPPVATEGTPSGSAADPPDDAFIEAAREVWQAMAERNPDVARARLNALAATVRDDRGRNVVRSLDQLLNHLEEFWRALAQGVARLEGGEEFAIGETYIIVVDSTPRELTIRAAGQNRTYLIRDIPDVLIRLIVRRTFATDPQTQSIYAAYLAVDPKGDPAQARRIWETAQRQGVDTHWLIEALRFAPAAGNEPPSAGSQPPDENARTAAASVIAQELAADIQAAQTAEQQIRLARALIDRGRRETDSARAYAALMMGRDWAVRAGDPSTAFAAVEATARRFAVDEWAAKVAVAGELIKSTRSRDGLRQLVDTSMAAARKAKSAGRQAEASQMAQVALEAARRTGNAALVRQLIADLNKMEIIPGRP